MKALSAISLIDHNLKPFLLPQDLILHRESDCFFDNRRYFTGFSYFCKGDVKYGP